MKLRSDGMGVLIVVTYAQQEDYGRGMKPQSDEASANARLWQVA